MKKRIVCFIGLCVLLSFLQSLDALEKTSFEMGDSFNGKRSSTPPIRPNVNLITENQASIYPKYDPESRQITGLDLNQPQMASFKPLNSDRTNSLSSKNTIGGNIDSQQNSKNAESCFLRCRLYKAEKDKQIWMRNFYIVMSLLTLSIGLSFYIQARLRKKKTPKTPVSPETGKNVNEKANEKVNEEKNEKVNPGSSAEFSRYMHDLGSNLNGLYLCSEHLDKNYDILEDEEIREFLGLMVKQSSEMATLLTNFKAWAAKERG